MAIWADYCAGWYGVKRNSWLELNILYERRMYKYSIDYAVYRATLYTLLAGFCTKMAAKLSWYSAFCSRDRRVNFFLALRWRITNRRLVLADSGAK